MTNLQKKLDTTSCDHQRTATRVTLPRNIDSPSPTSTVAFDDTRGLAVSWTLEPDGRTTSLAGHNFVVEMARKAVAPMS